MEAVMMQLVTLCAAFLALTAGSASATSPVACGTQFGTPRVGDGIPSNNYYSASFIPEDSYGAADFRVQTQCTLDEVDVKGFYAGPGRAANVNVLFYRNVPTANMPGQVIKAYIELPFSDPTGTGNFAIPIPSTTLMTGVYWVSVSANAEPPGWLWNKQDEQPGFRAMWRQNGDVLNEPTCLCWGNLDACNWWNSDGDFMFVLRGSGQ
jgi:hypothetical protein